MANIVHRGRVTDQYGQPLMGAHIVTINSSPKRGTVTDQNGNFTVNGNLHESFQIGYMGFKGQIFRLDRNMPDKVYGLEEDAYQLDGVVVRPHKPVPDKNKGIDFGGIFDAIGDIFGNIKPPAQNNPVYTGNPYPTAPNNGQGNVYNPQKEQSLSAWVKENPVASLGIFLGAAALGAVAIKKSKKTAK